MTAAESTTISIETGASGSTVMTVDPLAVAGMTMDSGPAVQGAILAIEY